MNIDPNNITAVDTAALFPDSLKEDILKLAAVGLDPAQIAAAIELKPDVATVFIILAEIPGTPVARLIAEGRANGLAKPQMKLQEAASTGNIDAIKTLRKLQRENMFIEQLRYMDDDEFTG